jgi:Lrp/AsnC family transcriptional regulator for asnA, asnC and gidA
VHGSYDVRPLGAHYGGFMTDSIVHLDEQDRILIALLQKRARMSYHELAEAVGVSPSTARRRVERLLDSGALKLVAVPCWSKLGFNLVALIGLSVELRRLDEVSRALAEMDEITWIAMTAGIYDIFAQIVLPTNEDLAYFITERIAPIEGIQNLQTIMVPRFTKSFEDYRLPLKPNPLYVHGRRDAPEVDEEEAVAR